jgi:hypothetical protein
MVQVLVLMLLRRLALVLVLEETKNMTLAAVPMLRRTGMLDRRKGLILPQVWPSTFMVHVQWMQLSFTKQHPHLHPYQHPHLHQRIDSGFGNVLIILAVMEPSLLQLNRARVLLCLRSGCVYLHGAVQLQC